MKKVKSTDLLLLLVFAIITVFHLYTISFMPFVTDESFYSLVPMRLVRGESLVMHEWHLSQFSALFSYLPVLIWDAVKDSAEGITLFLRYVYIAVHLATSIAIYAYFRKHGKWALITAGIFYLQVAYKIFAISYPTIFVIALLFLCFCLVSIYKKGSEKLYIPAGIFFACCCINNPLFCLVFVVYALVCLIWTKREAIELKLLEKKAAFAYGKDKKFTKKQLKERQKQLAESHTGVESYNCFFSKKAFLRFFYGILIVAFIAVVFYFATGGTISAVFNNMGNLLASSEYKLDPGGAFSKLLELFDVYTKATLYMPWVLPLIFIIMLIDNKRTLNHHRFAYLSAIIIWSVIFIVGIITFNDGFSLHAYSLPLAAFSITCYVMTKNKDKALFNCMYIPCLIGLVFQYLAANTHTAAIGSILAVANVAGVFFIKNFFEEFKNKDEAQEDKKRKHIRVYTVLITAIICTQVSLYVISYFQTTSPISEATKATEGPYAGLYMNDEQYNTYSNVIEDMNTLKEITNEKDPVLLITFKNWMYLHLDRPMATYTAWYLGYINEDLLADYYKKNPNKAPKYIYIEKTLLPNEKITILDELFDFTREELPNGTLLTVG